MTNFETFRAALQTQYEHLFANDPSYALAAKRTTPEEMARKFTAGLAGNGSVSKDGKGIETVCKALKIKHTYKALREYLAA